MCIDTVLLPNVSQYADISIYCCISNSCYVYSNVHGRDVCTPSTNIRTINTYKHPSTIKKSICTCAATTLT